MSVQNKSVFWIRDLDTLRVTSDPLRTQIFELCIPQSRTVREIAGLLGLAPTRLYYHMNLLEKHGLIVVEETRMVGNLVEKRYRSAATNLEIDAKLLCCESPHGNENTYGVVQSTLDSARDDLLRSLQARNQALETGAEPHPRPIVLNRVIAHLSDERAAAWTERILQLLADFEQDDAPDQQSFSLTLAYYPVFYYPGEEKEDRSGENSG